METNYENIVENYANNKKEELRDLQLKLLEQDNDIADQEEEELAEYREEIQNELSITLVSQIIYIYILFRDKRN